MIKVEIVKDGYGHSVGQVLELTEFDAGHLMAFGFAVPYVKRQYETAIEKPIEIRAEEKPVSIFGRRGRRKK